MISRASLRAGAALFVQALQRPWCGIWISHVERNLTDAELEALKVLEFGPAWRKCSRCGTVWFAPFGVMGVKMTQATMGRVQAVSTPQRALSAIPVVLGATVVGPALGNLLGGLLGAEVAASLVSELSLAGSYAVTTVLMTTGSAVREKLERDLALDAPRQDGRISWRDTFKKVGLTLLARIG